jgi:hypothetical protein
MPKLAKAARERYIPGWRKFLAQFWDEGRLYVDIAGSSPEPHAVQQMIMDYGAPGFVANMVAFDTFLVPRLADFVGLSVNELEKQFSNMGLVRRTETTITILAFVEETWNKNCWRIQQGRNFNKRPKIIDNVTDTCPHIYDEFLVSAASMTCISAASEPASASPVPTGLAAHCWLAPTPPIPTEPPPPPPPPPPPLPTAAADEFASSVWA